MKILLTGATGNIGSNLHPRLTAHEVTPVSRELPAESGFDLVIHAAADTRFTAPISELRAANVELTSKLLKIAPRIIHLSTLCVTGDTGGLIPETQDKRPDHFLNAYEETKWEAEELVLASGHPVEIVRLATACGSLADGSVPRPGGFHQALYWLYHGLVPMIPGHADTPVDLISLEFAAEAIARIANSAPRPGAIHHVSSGRQAVPLGRLLEIARDVFSQHHRGWRNGSLVLPQIVDAETYRLFERSVVQSGDALFRRVLRDASAFLPVLLHPRTAATSLIKPFLESETLARRSLDWLCQIHWKTH